MLAFDSIDGTIVRSKLCQNEVQVRHIYLHDCSVLVA